MGVGVGVGWEGVGSTRLSPPPKRAGSTGRQVGDSEIADFKIRVWRQGAVVREVADHAAAVRGFAMVGEVGFVSIGNDGCVGVCMRACVEGGGVGRWLSGAGAQQGGVARDGRLAAAVDAGAAAPAVPLRLR